MKIFIYFRPLKRSKSPLVIIAYTIAIVQSGLRIFCIYLHTKKLAIYKFFQGFSLQHPAQFFLNFREFTVNRTVLSVCAVPGTVIARFQAVNDKHSRIDRCINIIKCYLIKITVQRISPMNTTIPSDHSWFLQFFQDFVCKRCCDQFFFSDFIYADSLFLCHCAEHPHSIIAFSGYQHTLFPLSITRNSPANFLKL